MVENNRNRENKYRPTDDWTNDYDRQQGSYEDEPNYTISENRGYGNRARRSGMGFRDGGWQSRYEREINDQREGDFSGRRARHSDWRDEPLPEYRSDNRGLSSGYSDFGGNYSPGRESRNLYGRGYQGINRRDLENRENRIGGANYDTFGDHGRYDEEPYAAQGSFSYNNYYGRSRGNERDFRRPDYADYEEGNDYGSRPYGRGESEERSWWDRTTDEVSSWFGDQEADRRRERDRQLSGKHRGKGPRNYSRSDDRIGEDINDRLSDDPFVDATDIEVTISNGDVTLAGTVDHRSTKRRAEDLADAVSGVKNVENRLRVSELTTNEGRNVSGTNESSGPAMPKNSAPVPGADRGRGRESSYSNK